MLTLAVTRPVFVVNFLAATPVFEGLLFAVHVQLCALFSVCVLSVVVLRETVAAALLLSTTFDAAALFTDFLVVPFVLTLAVTRPVFVVEFLAATPVFEVLLFAAQCVQLCPLFSVCVLSVVVLRDAADDALLLFATFDAATLFRERFAGTVQLHASLSSSCTCDIFQSFVPLLKHYFTNLSQ